MCCIICSYSLHKTMSVFCEALKRQCRLAVGRCTAHKEGGKPVLTGVVFPEREIIYS